MTKTVVIGGAGFIGSHVVEELESQGHTVMVLDSFATGRRENLKNTRAEVKMTAIQRMNMLTSNMNYFEPDYVIHLAAQSAIGTSWNDPRYDQEVNIFGTINVILAARECGAKKIVFSSTSAVYKPTQEVLTEDSITAPDTPYGISKLAAEGYLRAMYGDAAVILRFGNVYGPRQVPLGENQVIARMIQHLEQGTPFSIHGNGEQKRSFVYVKDVARACALALESDPNTYNIAALNSHSVNMVADVISLIYGDVKTWKHDQQMDPRGDVNMSPLCAMTEMGWAASTSLRDGLQATVEWWRNGCQ